MRKDDRLRRSELFLPPPSVNTRRPTIPPDAELEEKQIKAFVGFVLLAGVLGLLLTAVMYGTGVWVASNILESTGTLTLGLRWFDCVVISVIFILCRTWDRASRPKKK